MVNPANILSGLTFLMTVKDRQQSKRESQQQAQMTNGDSSESADLRVSRQISQRQKETNDRLQRLLEIKEKRNPSPSDKDAYASAVIDLADGETAEVVVEPDDGYNLRVERVYFDKRNDHDYEINVGGDVTSVNHRAVYTSPRRVAQADRVIATVTNNSGSSSTVDFEMDAWAEKPGKRNRRGRYS